MKIDAETYNYPKEFFTKQRINMRNLWFLMKVDLLLSMYNLVFAVISLIQANVKAKDPNAGNLCNIITTNVYVDEWFWLVNRLFSYTIWMWPIMRIFWNHQKNSLSEIKALRKMEKKK
jgi:hypothetical protein